MNCDSGSLYSLITLLIWGLPVLAGIWIWNRRKIAGASLFVGKLILGLWALSLALMVLSLFVGISKLEGNSRDGGCWFTFGMLAVLVGAYAVLFRTYRKPPRGA